MNDLPCPCGSQQTLVNCCAQYHGGKPAANAEVLMRSRYSAYVLGLIDYLVSTTLAAQQNGLNRQAISAWSQGSEWLGLQVESHEPQAGSPAHAYVTFVAHWRDAQGEHSHRERSAFVEHGGHWFFIDPTVPLKAGRNDSCLCASGLKFKKCCAPYFV